MELSDYQVVYFNDFEEGDLSGISNGVIRAFNDEQVIGNYNKSGFTLKLNDLPKHSVISITTNLYIHDSWDGNQAFPGGPDIWGIRVDEWVSIRNKLAEELIFETSFSNSVCNEVFCLRQSFPDQHEGLFNPRSGALNTQLPGICQLINEPNGTTLYRIEKVFPHKGQSLAVQFYDRLEQSNSQDQGCDESWSIGELEVGIWKTN